MRTIYKYPIVTHGTVKVIMPERAKILHAGFAPDGIFAVWALVRPANDMATYIFISRQTGDNVPAGEDPGEHVSTVVMESVGYVIHVFYLEQESPHGTQDNS